MKVGIPLTLCIPQYREAGITTYTYGCIRFEPVNNFSYLEKTFYQLKWQTNIFYQRTAIEPCYIQVLQFYILPVVLFPFPFFLLPLQIIFQYSHQFFQRIGNSDCRENMAACSATCYDHFLLILCFAPTEDFNIFTTFSMECHITTHDSLLTDSPLSATSDFPSNCSTFLATLNMIPIANR